MHVYANKNFLSFLPLLLFLNDQMFLKLSETATNLRRNVFTLSLSQFQLAVFHILYADLSITPMLYDLS